jgi:hypothetical protein
VSLDIKALAITGAILWGGSYLLVGLLNLASPGYGTTFLDLAKSIYPGYGGPAGFGSVIVVTLYAALDGAVAGALLAWLYNLLARQGSKSAAAG